MSVLLIWLFCFVVDPIAWVCIHGQFLHALPVKPGMRVSSPTPICGIVHSTIIADPHCLLSPGLTWTSASSEEGNVRYPQASVTRLHCTDPKKQVWVKNASAHWSSMLPPWIYLHSHQEIQVHIKRHKCNPLQQHFVITKSISLLIAPLLSTPLQHTHTYTLTHAQTVGQWDYEGEGDHLSQSAVMIVYQRMEEWSGSRWWKQAV